MMYFLTALFLTGILLFLLHIFIRRRYHSSLPYPPGPLGLPIVGYLPFLGSFPPKTLSKLADKYGPIFSVQLGSKFVIVLSSYDAIQEAMVNQGKIFAGRPSDLAYDAHEKREVYSFVMRDGKFWRELRRFTVATFRDYGVGKLSLEPKILEEIGIATVEIRKLNGRSTDLSNLIGSCISNLINLLLFNRRYAYDDSRFQQVREGIAAFLKSSDNSGAWRWIPAIRKCSPLMRFFCAEGYRQKVTYLMDFVKDHISEHKRIHKAGQRNDYLHAFLSEKENRKYSDDCNELFGPESCFDNTRLMFNGGSETTFSLLQWALLYMVLYPDFQSKARKEVDDVIGSRLPSYSDRIRTPYVEAFLMETHRVSNIVPLSVLHSTLADTTLNGFHIPKKTYVMTNLWHVHHDQKLWKDPDVFNPERFLDEDKRLIKTPHLIGFGIGKRVCPGESLARMESYLFLTIMLQQFIFKLPDNEMPSAEPVYGLTCPPKPYRVCAISRNFQD